VMVLRGKEVERRWMAASILVWEEEEIVIMAVGEDARIVSATANPIPEEPPMMRMCFPASLSCLRDAITNCFIEYLIYLWDSE